MNLADVCAQMPCSPWRMLGEPSAGESEPSASFLMTSTHGCACAGCVPCRAKVLRAAGAAEVPNARPESCLRLVSPSKSPAVARAFVGIYRRGQKILTVGDGDFSFSLGLARVLGGRHLLATSYESLTSLQQIYGSQCTETLRELASRGAHIAHGVDASDLLGTLPPDCLPSGEALGNRRAFDRIVWNFPCVARGTTGAVLTGAGAGADARGGFEIEENRLLVNKFCVGGASLLVPRGGEIHLTHKVGLQQWGIEGQGTGAGLSCHGAVVFDRAAYPPYRPRKALDARSFPITDAQTFVLGNTPCSEGSTLGGVGLVLPMTPSVVKAATGDSGEQKATTGSGGSCGGRKRKGY